MTKDEMQNFIFRMNKDFFLNDLWKIKDEFLCPEDESIKESIFYLPGLYLIYIMQGELDKAKEILDSLPENTVLKLSMHICYPCITGREFFEINEKLLALEHDYLTITLTAGRPFVLNGVGDFTRLGVFLPKNKKKALPFFKNLYPNGDAERLYEVCLAEYYYQQNKLYDAELLISRAIKCFDDTSDMRCLFVALFQQLLLLIVNNECPSIPGYFKEMRSRLSKHGSQEFMYNMNAIEAWISSYEGKYEYIYNWFNTDAPDEYGDFNMLDLFRYMIKLRCYLVQENHIALVALVEKLRPFLVRALRPKDLCLLDYILAMSLHSQGKMSEAFTALERAVKIAKHHGYDRVAADEGSRMLRLLLDYNKAKPDDPYILHLIEITRHIAILYPNYLTTPVKNEKKFTQTERDILRLLEQGKTNDEISECYLISVNTVKYHLKKIYSKLGVKSATQAVWKAKLSGIIK